MDALKGSQRKYLRGVAHGYRPLVHVGKEGLGESVFRAIDEALEARELVKVKFTAERAVREEMIPLVEARLSCECAGRVGHMAIFYRRQSDPAKRRIALPGAGD